MSLRSVATAGHAQSPMQFCTFYLLCIVRDCFVPRNDMRALHAKAYFKTGRITFDWL
jgi:hypothetical protein